MFSFPLILVIGMFAFDFSYSDFLCLDFYSSGITGRISLEMCSFV